MSNAQYLNKGFRPLPAHITPDTKEEFDYLMQQWNDYRNKTVSKEESEHIRYIVSRTLDLRFQLDI